MMVLRKGLPVSLKLCLSLIGVLSVIAKAAGQCDPTGPRKDCGYSGIPISECEGKGCCYDPAPPYKGDTDLILPACFYANGGESTFVAAAAPVIDGNGAAHTVLHASTMSMPEFGPDVVNLTYSVQYLTPEILRVKIWAPGRWEVPHALFKTEPSIAGAKKPATVQYNVTMTTNPFGFAVSRANSTAAPLFNTKGHRMVFKDQYIEVTTHIPKTSSLYGYSERTPSQGFRLQRDGIPMATWTRDSAAADPDLNSYGAWPFYMEIREDGSAHGVLLLNSNGMDLVITPDALSWRVIGGQLDFYFLMGPTPLAVMEQLTSIIGRPFMPPYWSLGLMNSKYGIPSVEIIDRIVDSYRYANIPLETFVSDSQYMDGDQDFTLSPSYPLPAMKAFVDKLHANGQRWVPIIDPIIHIKPGYVPYDSGIKEDIFIKDITGKPYVAQLWPGAAHLPDFLHRSAPAWWQDQIQSVYKDLPLDGIWLDMNEISGYCTGDVCIDPGNVGPNNNFVCELLCEKGPNAFANASTGVRAKVPAGVFDPPYRINNANKQMDLRSSTLPPSASHHGGVLEYDVHNMYGFTETIATAAALRNIRNKRHFVFSRSSFLGSGAYGAHWTGDTSSTWDDLRWSIPAVFMSGLAGIPFVGGDICGFMNLATEELCARWIAVGAFYPYARMHHAQGFQELYRWPKVAEAARKVLQARYRALPYLYTAFWQAHKFGCPIARPLLFAAPADPAALANDAQWLMGDAMLVSPVLHRGANSTDAYFPGGTVWYSLYDGAPIDASSGGKVVTLQAGLTDDVPLHIAGGFIVPLGQGGMTTTEARTSPLSLLVAFPKDPSSPGLPSCGGLCGPAPKAKSPSELSSCGAMFLDGGEDLEIGSARDNKLQFNAHISTKEGSGTGELVLSWPEGANVSCSGNVSWPHLKEVVLLGAGQVNASSVTLQVGSAAAIGVAADSVVVNNSTGAVTVAGLNVTLKCPQPVSLRWSSSELGAPTSAAVTHGTAAVVTGPPASVLGG
eukprot:jgi/Botrbrau1/1278/Bobra.0163s0061.1